LAAITVQRNLTRRFLVSAEFTLALVLLIGFGLLLRSFLLVESIPVGIRTDRLLTTATNLTAPKFKDPAKKIMYTRTLLDRVREIPGVEAAVATSDLPLTGAGAANIQIEGISSTDPQGTEVRYISASPAGRCRRTTQRRLRPSWWPTKRWLRRFFPISPP
jgi:hypothetical protein